MTTDKTNTAGAAAQEKETVKVAANDRNAVQARWAQEREAERTTLAETLRGAGAARIVAHYDGYGDSGNVHGITVSPDSAEIGDIKARLADFVWDVAYGLNPGFENNDGGEGTVTWDIAADRIDVDHANFYTERDEYLHKDVT